MESRGLTVDDLNHLEKNLKLILHRCRQYRNILRKLCQLNLLALDLVPELAGIEKQFEDLKKKMFEADRLKMALVTTLQSKELKDPHAKSSLNITDPAYLIYVKNIRKITKCGMKIHNAYTNLKKLFPKGLMSEEYGESKSGSYRLILEKLKDVRKFEVHLPADLEAGIILSEMHELKLFPQMGSKLKEIESKFEKSSKKIPIIQKELIDLKVEITGLESLLGLKEVEQEMKSVEKLHERAEAAFLHAKLVNNEDGVDDAQEALKMTNTAIQFKQRLVTFKETLNTFVSSTTKPQPVVPSNVSPKTPLPAFV